MNPTKPTRKPDVIVQDVGNGALLYSAEGKVVHALNLSAKHIWELCDGKHTTWDMVRALRASFSTAPEHDVARDIRRTLGVLADKGLLQEG